MKILVLLPYLPYEKVPHAGGRFTYHVLKEIGHNNELHGITFINYGYEKEMLRSGKELFRGLEAVRLSPADKLLNFILFPWLPLRFAFRMSPVFLNKLIRKRGQGFDAVLLDHSIMGAYAPLVRKLFPDACLAWNVHELSSFSRRRKEKLAAYNPVRRLAFLFERIRSQIAEKMIYSSCDLVLTFSSAEYGSIRSAGCPADKVQFVQPHVDGHAGTDGARPSSSSGGVLFFGKMDRENNRDAAEILIKEVFPRIKQKVPGARCYILGAEPPERLTRLASVDVEISGYVEDFKRYLTSIKVAVFPLRMGSGIKFKILDALSWGIPVITTGVGVEGIEGISPALRIADRPEEMAEQAVQVLSMDRERYEPLSGEARDFISRNYDWQGNCEAIENMINWCQNKKRGRKTGRERAVRTIQ